MANPSCSLWIFVARPDTSFLLQTIPHLVKVHNFPFDEKVLAVDTAPLMGDKVTRPHIGTMEELRECTEKLLQAGVVDRVVDINYDANYHNEVYRKHFGTPIRFTHNYKGYPILGSIFSIEECKSDYMLHFDSDMLMFQQPNHNWIAEAVKLMEENPKMMFVRPLAGPPTNQPKSEPFDTFKTFGSRVYLIDCKRFDKFLPIPVLWRSYNTKWMNDLPTSLKTILSNFTGKGKLDSWEIMVTQKLEQTDYFRANLTNPAAWTLHPKDRSQAFLQALPNMIARIEAGDFPQQQAGEYDLIPQAWY
ncbi:conserved hypothetical protein [Trichormus variabilis ATCC 29413]|uniref:Uncharacterized protein n=2 Tax=Anabaena variabilis TaxID=264691 RepID=Q3M6S8_TRIV2|nr:MULTISPECIES: hypothetical protein [Nostocaceae]ABA23308.1 conserved hypothetical protein [Trichormus variabilis ATCC 29413]MBC1217505.1 hypothetical protein [Trichormus variabilis ARAD]MBC1257329.1 hypothetical protein [Trichormus variabilis V5]MBC1270295.1 hypothetical protein [Trichormus variabilis FSR]MBC1305277.1 hypothetical protein [Trichormus variabilis N2B]